jgi:hypothetical protein
MPITDDIAQAAIKVVEELASEIDLYYDDDEIKTLGPKIGKIFRLCHLLYNHGIDTPETCQFIIKRFSSLVDKPEP